MNPQGQAHQRNAACTTEGPSPSTGTPPAQAIIHTGKLASRLSTITSGRPDRASQCQQPLPNVHKLR